MHRSLVVVLVLALPLALLACGADDEADIADAIETSATTDDPSHCTELLTQDFVEQTTFETGEAAVETCEENASDPSDDAEAVEVSNVSVEEDTATADAAFTGGALDGATATIALVKEGDQWQLNRLEGFREFDPQAFRDSFGRQLSDAENLTARQKSCIGQQIALAGDDDLEQLALGDEEALLAIVGPC